MEKLESSELLELLLGTSSTQLQEVAKEVNDVVAPLLAGLISELTAAGWGRDDLNDVSDYIRKCTMEFLAERNEPMERAVPVSIVIGLNLLRNTLTAASWEGAEELLRQFALEKHHPNTKTTGVKQ